MKCEVVAPTTNRRCSNGATRAIDGHLVCLDHVKMILGRKLPAIDGTVISGDAVAYELVLKLDFVKDELQSIRNALTFGRVLGVDDVDTDKVVDRIDRLIKEAF